MWEVYRRSPELKQIPYDLNSFEPPFAKRFALRQHQLMQQGMSKEAAYQDTEKEMAMHKQELLKYVFVSTTREPNWFYLQCLRLLPSMLPCLELSGNLPVFSFLHNPHRPEGMTASTQVCRQAGYVLPKYSVIATIQEQEEQELAEAYEEHQKYK